MESIYSRKRLKVPKLSFFTKFKIAFGLILLGLLLFIIQFVIYVYPIFEASCKSKAETIGTTITSKEVNKVMVNYDYNDLIYIEKGKDGEIAMVKARIVPINEIISSVTANIKSEIDNEPEVSVPIDIGKATGIKILSKIGPSINMKLESSRPE